MKTKSKFLVTLLLAVAFVFTVFTGVTLIDTANADTGITSFETKYTSIRVEGKSGLRFQTVIEGSFDGTYTFGTLLLPEDLVGTDGELTHEDAKIVDVKQTVWANAERTAFNAVLTDIPETSAGYNRKIVARGYYQVNGGDYVYATPLTRSTAQTAAMLEAQGKGNDFTAEILEVALPELTISASALDMVAGGKETLTVNTDLPVVWASSKQDVATVANGVVTAVANGETVITATLGERTVECTVTVADYIQKDGSELVWSVKDAEGETYAIETASIGGRTNTYKLSTTDTNLWDSKLNVAETKHREGESASLPYNAFNNIKKKAYSYITFDFYMEAGSYMRVYTREIDPDIIVDVDNKVFNDLYNYTLLTANAVVNNNSAAHSTNLNVYSRGAKVGYTYAGQWYTAVIDYSPEVLGVYNTNSVAIEISAFVGTFYFDNVRYYGNDSCYDDFGANTFDGYIGYDGSEFVWGNNPNPTTSYIKLSTDTIGGRTGVYEYTSNNSWNDRLTIYEAGHPISGTNANVHFGSSAAAFANLTNLGYNYITFDVYLATAGAKVRIQAPEASGAADKRDDFSVGSVVTNNNTNISTYIGATVLADTDTISTGVWYTVIIDHKTAVAPAWSAIFLNCSGTVYLDNVRYYSSNPFA